MSDLLIKLKIIQRVSNTERKKLNLKVLGKGYSYAYRFNFFNPLSYITILLFSTILILKDGFIGFYKEFNNPFSWN